MPDEWPGAPAPLASPAALPQPGRPVRPDGVPSEVAVGDLTPARLVQPVGLASTEGWLHPLPIEAQEQSPWGWRWSAARGTWRMHTGVDLIVPAGTPVLAARSGRVVLAEEVNGYGLTVLLDHGDGWQTLYAHLQRMVVAAGERIGRGQQLGRVGDTGRASTPHLHLELRRRSERGVLAVTPTVLLQAARASTPVLAAEPLR